MIVMWRMVWTWFPSTCDPNLWQKKSLWHKSIEQSNYFAWETFACANIFGLNHIYEFMVQCGWSIHRIILFNTQFLKKKIYPNEWHIVGLWWHDFHGFIIFSHSQISSCVPLLILYYKSRKKTTLIRQKPVWKS